MCRVAGPPMWDKTSISGSMLTRNIILIEYIDAGKLVPSDRWDVPSTFYPCMIGDIVWQQGRPHSKIHGGKGTLTFSEGRCHAAVHLIQRAGNVSKRRAQMCLCCIHFNNWSVESWSVRMNCRRNALDERSVFAESQHWPSTLVRIQYVRGARWNRCWGWPGSSW